MTASRPRWRRENDIEKLKILVVDDTRTILLLLQTLLTKHGHTVVTASDGLEAIRAFLHEDPDVILMDVMMPNMDGIEAAQHIRDISAVIPIFFLSADTGEESVRKALQIGSDYIAKPLQPAQLLDKLNAHFRAVLAYREVVEQKKEVQRLHDTMVEESRVAAHVLRRMLSRTEYPSTMLQYTVIPSGIFSGDIVLAGTTPSGKLNVILADAIGHGLPAAFSVMPLVPAFEAMTRKGFPLEDILVEINRRLKSVMPLGRFIAATAVSVDFHSGACEVWVGGNPAVMILSQGSLSHVASSHLALGLNEIEDRAAFVCESLQLQPSDRLVLFSDGLTEAWDRSVRSAEGELAAFIRNCPPAEIFDRVVATTQNYHRHDDTSLVVLHMGSVVDAPRPPPSVPLGNASLALSLDAAQLSDPEIAHTVINLAIAMKLVAADDGQFAVVFSELFANALDHGVLGIPSEIKYANGDGFENYMRLRSERLEALTHGAISVRIEKSEFAGKLATLLNIVDSGPGFDQAVLLDDGPAGQEVSAGRGIKLVLNICYDVSFAGSGNQVSAYIPRQR